MTKNDFASAQKDIEELKIKLDNLLGCLISLNYKYSTLWHIDDKDSRDAEDSLEDCTAAINSSLFKIKQKLNQY